MIQIPELASALSVTAATASEHWRAISCEQRSSAPSWPNSTFVVDCLCLGHNPKKTQLMSLKKNYLQKTIQKCDQAKVSLRKFQLPWFEIPQNVVWYCLFQGPLAIHNDQCLKNQQVKTQAAMRPGKKTESSDVTLAAKKKARTNNWVV